MKLPNAKWCWGIAGTVGGAVFLFGLNAQLGHYAQGGQDTQDISQNTRSIKQTEEIQEKLAGIVEYLSSIHRDADAALAKVAELCRSGKFRDCEDCAAAGVELPACMTE